MQVTAPPPLSRPSPNQLQQFPCPVVGRRVPSGPLPVGRGFLFPIELRTLVSCMICSHHTCLSSPTPVPSRAGLSFRLSGDWPRTRRTGVFPHIPHARDTGLPSPDTGLGPAGCRPHMCALKTPTHPPSSAVEIGAHTHAGTSCGPCRVRLCWGLVSSCAHGEPVPSAGAALRAPPLPPTLGPLPTAQVVCRLPGHARPRPFLSIPTKTQPCPALSS